VVVLRTRTTRQPPGRRLETLAKCFHENTPSTNVNKAEELIVNYTRQKR
jgi:hypothetical protein